MNLNNFLLTLHVMGAIAGFGATFAFPFIGAMAQKPGAPVPWLLRLNELLESKWVTPIAATLQPGTGAGLIIVSHGQYDPFASHGRWLLAGIILYIIAFFYALLVQTPLVKKAIHMLEAGPPGPEFGALMKRAAMGGQFLTVLLVTIIILMVVKPGSGVIHP